MFLVVAGHCLLMTAYIIIHQHLLALGFMRQEEVAKLAFRREGQFGSSVDLRRYPKLWDAVVILVVELATQGFNRPRKRSERYMNRMRFQW